MNTNRRSSTGLVALAVKLGPKLGSALLKFAKVIKFGKLTLAGASFASYAYLFTWKFALLIMSMLFIHESGHVWAMRRCGVKTRGFYFIPFIGGAAIAEEAFPSRKAEVYIAIMGPIWGFGTAIIAAFGYVLTLEPWWAAAASWIAMVNLFNLLPINPLDGGRIMKSIAFSIHSWAGFLFLGIGILAGIILTFHAKMGLFALLLTVAFIELTLEFRRRHSHNMPKMGLLGIFGSAGSYAAIIFLLWYIMYLTGHIPGAEAATSVLR